MRSELPLTTLLPSLTSATSRASSPEVAVTFRPFRDILRDGLLRERLMASLSAFFGFLAALLAMVGLYGVVSFMVVRRRNEIGVRMAMGATRRDILLSCCARPERSSRSASPIGIVLAVGAARFARSLLYGLRPERSRDDRRRRDRTRRRRGRREPAAGAPGRRAGSGDGPAGRVASPTGRDVRRERFERGG